MFNFEIFETFCMFLITVLKKLKVYTVNLQLASAYEQHMIHKSEKGHNILSKRIHNSNNLIVTMN